MNPLDWVLPRCKECGRRMRPWEKVVVRGDLRLEHLTCDRRVEGVARAFHQTYERLAPNFGWRTQKRSQVPWDEVPEPNRELMMAVVQELADHGVVRLP